MSDHIREMVRRGYDPNEHPFVVEQAKRIREMEAEVERLRADLAHAILQLQPNVGGGRESGGTAGVTEDESPRQGTPAAAYPAARKEAGRCDSCGKPLTLSDADYRYCVDCAVRKEASP